MSKTVKELADEFKVSKQAISKQLTKDFRANHVKKVTTNGLRQLSIDDEGYSVLKAHFNKETNQLPTANVGGNVGTNTDNLVDELKKQLEFQKRELESKNLQLNNKDEQITDLHKLLDQSQRLQLMAEKKIEKLESPKEDKKEAPEKETLEVKQEEPKKKPWWRF